MNKIILSLLLLSTLYSTELEFKADPKINGLEYCIKPNGSMVFRQSGARVPERKDQEVAQVLNPEFICDLPTKEDPKRETQDIANTDQKKEPEKAIDLEK